MIGVVQAKSEITHRSIEDFDTVQGKKLLHIRLYVAEVIQETLARELILKGST